MYILERRLMSSLTAKLTVESLRAGYAGMRIVDGISFEVRSGERLGLLGRNGAGKTTTLACLMGLVSLQSGKILFDDLDISNWPTYRRSRAGLGYVPQTRDIFASLSVEENLVAAVTCDDDMRRLTLIYDLFPRLKERRNNGGAQLSGGEQQMLAVGRAMIPGPKILLMDEPLEGLAPKVRDDLLRSTEEMVRVTGVGCVLVEQHVDVVLEFCSRVMVLERGVLAFSGTSDELRSNGRILESAIGLKKGVSPHAIG